MDRFVGRVGNMQLLCATLIFAALLAVLTVMMTMPHGQEVGNFATYFRDDGWLLTAEWLEKHPGAILYTLVILIGAAVIFFIFSLASLFLSIKRKIFRSRLRQFYVEVGPIITRSMPKDISDADFEKYIAEAQAWVSNTANLIETNMGIPARARFLDQTGLVVMSVNGAVNETHKTMVNNLSRWRQNLLAIIESGAWEKR